MPVVDDEPTLSTMVRMSSRYEGWQVTTLLTQTGFLEKWGQRTLRRHSPSPALLTVAWANLVVVFVVELAGLAAFGLWGAQAVTSTPGRWALAIGLPLIAAVLWGLCCAPRATVALPPFVVAVIKVAMLMAAVLALMGAGLPYAAIALATVGPTTALLARILPRPVLPHET